MWRLSHLWPRQRRHQWRCKNCPTKLRASLKVLIQKILEASPPKERRAPEPVLPTPAPPAAAPATANAAMEALMSFANNTPQTGPISHTALRMQQEQGVADPALAAAMVPPPDLATRRPDAPVAAQPALGAGLDIPPTAPWNWSTPLAAGQPASAPAASAGSRWSHGLPADLPRAAPEIYRSLRAEAAANAREWLSAHFKGSRACTNGEWTGLWNAATELDFFVDSLPADQVMQQLATSDMAEMHLRALASHVYQARTSDSTGAAMMLAVRPPGVESDIAPAWLISDVTQYSKAEHQRWQRVNQRGRGRGRGRGDQGRGRDDAGAAADAGGRGRGAGRK